MITKITPAISGGFCNHGVERRRYKMPIMPTWHTRNVDGCISDTRFHSAVPKIADVLAVAMITHASRSSCAGFS